MAFLQNCWYVAGFDTELDAAFLARRILDEPIVFFRQGDGRIAALADRCPHRLVPLSIGKRIGDTLQCGYHGTIVAGDGSCVSIPGQSHVPAASSTRTYPAAERHGLVWVWMGPPELATPATIPDLRWQTEPGWATARGHIHFAADYRLITDNLLDLSHETYIHQNSIGNREEETIASFRAVVTVREGRRVMCRREMPNIETPPLFAAIGMSDRIDRLQLASYAAPGLNMTEAGYRNEHESGDFRLFLRIMHLLTPETERTAHYFFTSSRHVRPDEPELTDLLRRGTISTFGEDKFVLELQQQALEECGDDRVPRMTIALDAGPIQGRRILEAAIEREQADPTFVAEPPALVGADLKAMGYDGARAAAVV